MKHKFNEFLKLAVFILGALGIAGMIFLVALALSHQITSGWFLFWLATDTLVLCGVSIYIEDHFVDGEWV